MKIPLRHIALVLRCLAASALARLDDSTLDGKVPLLPPTAKRTQE